MGFFTSESAQLLLHNKYAAVLGDSIQRNVYKDLVTLLQEDKFLSDAELKRKGELSFANDCLVEGGSKGEMHNGPGYREVRQYRSDHHLVRFYFLTRVYSEYLESVLADFKAGPSPDVLIMNSCIWDLNSYDDKLMESYRTNLERLFSRLSEVLSPECLVIWNLTMPVGFKAAEMPESSSNHNLRWDVIRGNFCSSTLANLHKMDVVDMHYYFRFDLRSRCRDAVHWNQLAHRKYSQILLAHIAQAWGVTPPEAPKVKSHAVPCVPPPPMFPMVNAAPHHVPPFHNQEFGQRFIEPTYMGGYTAFDPDDREIESFMRGSMGIPAKQMAANALSPFVSDSPLVFGNLPPRNGSYGPMINNRHFSGMPIPPYHLPVPEMQFGTFHYTAWRGRHPFSRRRDIRPPHPYQHYRPPYPTRN